MQLQLISKPGCPFVQRASIMLLEKDVPYDVKVVDLSSKPAWFVALSPRGMVPVLVADGTAIFESTAICEFLEETHPEPPLFPRDPVARARDRGWFAFTTEDLSQALWRMATAGSPEARSAARADVDRGLTRLEQELGERDWLSGDGRAFGMADVFAAPFFVRASLLEGMGRYSLPAALSSVRRYCDRLLSRDSVKRSTAPDLEARLRALPGGATPPPGG